MYATIAKVIFCVWALHCGVGAGNRASGSFGVEFQCLATLMQLQLLHRFRVQLAVVTLQHCLCLNKVDGYSGTDKLG